LIWAVENGYVGNGDVCALVEATDEKDAFIQAIEAFSTYDKRELFSAPNPSWKAYVMEFPYVCEMS
jgi:hypothetical protein